MGVCKTRKSVEWLYGVLTIPREDLLPVRLHNAVASLDNPLRYPPGVNTAPPMPNTKAELRRLTRERVELVFCSSYLTLAPYKLLNVVQFEKHSDLLHLYLARP